MYQPPPSPMGTPTARHACAVSLTLPSAASAASMSARRAAKAAARSGPTCARVHPTAQAPTACLEGMSLTLKTVLMRLAEAHGALTATGMGQGLLMHARRGSKDQQACSCTSMETTSAAGESRTVCARK